MRLILIATTMMALGVSACATSGAASRLVPSSYVGAPITEFSTAFGAPSAIGEDEDGIRVARFDFLVGSMAPNGPQLPVIRYAPREEAGSSPTGQVRLAGGVPISSSQKRPCSIIARYGEDDIIQSIEASSHRCARIQPA